MGYFRLLLCILSSLDFVSHTASSQQGGEPICTPTRTHTLQEPGTAGQSFGSRLWREEGGKDLAGWVSRLAKISFSAAPRVGLGFGAP